MPRYKITPLDIKTGNTAPYFVEDIEDESKVEKIAEGLSPLFQHERWHPSIDKLVTKRKRK